MSSPVDWIPPYDPDAVLGQRFPDHMYDDLIAAGLGGGGGGGGTPGPSTVTTTQVNPATLITASEGVGANVNDTTWPTTAAVREYVDAKVAAAGGGSAIGGGTSGYQTSTERFHAAVATCEEMVVPIAFCGSSTTEGTAVPGLPSVAFRWVNQFMTRLQTANPKVDASPHPNTVIWGSTTTPPSPSATTGLFGVNYGLGGTSVTGVGAGQYLGATASTKTQNLINLKPQVIFHLIGGNDWLNSTSSAGTPALYRTGLELKLTEISNGLSSGTPTPHVHVLITPWESWSAAYNPPWEFNEYCDAMKEVASVDPYRRVFMDLRSLYKAIGIPPDGVHVTDEFNLIGSDDTHGDQSGHKYLAKMVYDMLHSRPLGVIPATVDTTAPTPPTLAYAANDAASITYSINPALGGALATDNVGVTGYIAYAGASDGQYSAGTVLQTGITTLNWTRGGLNASTSYATYYKAVDAKGNTSVASNTVTHSTGTSSDVTNPTPPTLALSTVTPTSIAYTFSGATDDVGVTSYSAFAGARDVLAPNTSLATGITTSPWTRTGLTSVIAPAWVSNGTQLSGATSTAADVPIPASVTVNDVIVVFMYLESTAAVTPPAGFTEATSSPVIVTGASAHYLRVYWKRQTSATGAGETTGNYGFTVASNVHRSGIATRYTGAIRTGDPFDTGSGAPTSAIAVTASTVTPAVSLTTSRDNHLLVWAASTFAGRTITTPVAGFTERFDGGTGCEITIDTSLKAAAGATGSLTATWSGTTASGAWLGALIPQTYDTYLRAYDGAGNESINSNTVTRATATADVELPTPPTLTLSSFGSGSITYGFSGATDNVGVVSYNSYAGATDPLPDDTLITTGITTSPYTRGGLAGGVTHATYLKSVDGAGNISATGSNTITQATTAYRAHSDPALIVDIDPNADTGILALADGAKVTSLTPSAGLEAAKVLVQTNVPSQPTVKVNAINSRRALVFANAHLLTSPNFSKDYGPSAGVMGGSAGPLTVYVVAKYAAAGSSGNVFSGNASGVYCNLGVQSVQSALNLDLYAGAQTPVVRLLPTPTYFVVCAIFNGTTSKGMLNVSTGGTTGSTGTGSNARLSGIRVGAGSAGTAGFLTGEVARVIIVNGRSTDGNIATEMLALGADYAISVT